MKKFLVEDVKVGVSKGGIACGPVAGVVVAEVRLRDMEGGSVKFHSLSEVEGTLNFLETEESTFDAQIADEYDDEGWEELENSTVGDYMDYREFYADLAEQKVCDANHAPIWKFLAYLVRAGWDEIDRIKAENIGRCLGDFEIPVCDAEQDYLDDRAEEEIEIDVPDTGSPEEFLKRLNDEFTGSKIDTSSFDGMAEDESPAGWYSAYAGFREGNNDYRFEYSLWVDDDAEIASIDWPKCEKRIGEEYVPCPDAEVSARRIYDELREELNNWF